jgi:hypothetical protein
MIGVTQLLLGYEPFQQIDSRPHIFETLAEFDQFYIATNFIEFSLQIHDAPTIEGKAFDVVSPVQFGDFLRNRLRISAAATGKGEQMPLLDPHPVRQMVFILPLLHVAWQPDMGHDIEPGILVTKNEDQCRQVARGAEIKASVAGPPTSS